MADDLDKKEAPPEAFSSRSSLDSGKKGKPSTSAKVREVMKMKTKKDKIRMAVAITLCLVVIAGIITGAVLGAKAAKDKDKETTQPPPTTEPPTQPSYRLPDHLKPIEYWVSLQPMVNGDFKIYGDVTVEMQVVKATTNITLHIVDIITKNETVKVTKRQTEDGPEASVTVAQQVYDAEREFYIAMLDEELPVDNWVTFSISFEGLLNDQMRGFYRSSYTAPDGSTKWLGVTQFQADDARMAFPCMDEPALKAKFTISLARETNMSAISNMPLSDTVDIEDQPGWVWDHFETSVPMSTYLVAFIVSDFSSLSDGNFSVWARDEMISQGQEALDVGPAILTYYEEYFSIPYPLPKTDMAAIPDFAAGAMENWGLITYREEDMLLPPGASASVHQRVVVVVAHELAHQWFGNLVTPSWWTDIWLNEGFASYLEYLGTDHMYPEMGMLDQMALTMQYVMIEDGLPSTHPVSQEVEHPDDIGQIFDSISYDKGMSVIRMMNHFLTEDTFRTGLTSYLNDFAYQAADQDDLWEHLTEAANADGQEILPPGVTVKDIMDTWTLQGGYPVLNVTRTEAGTSATVSQQRFLLAGNSSGSDGEGSWWVPVSHTSANAPNFTVTKPNFWIAKDVPTVVAGSLPAKEHWVIFNVQGTAYYRVNYDAENWALISTQLMDNHAVIDGATRSQLIDDSLSLARGGYLNYETALGLVNYMEKETDFVPWSAALDGLSYLEQMLTRSGAYGDFRRYMISILQPLYDNVGFVDSTNDLHLDQYKRSLAVSWACKMEHEDCLTNARTAFDLWINNDTEVSANIKAAVYCTGVFEGGQEAWEAVWERYLDSEVASEKTHLLNALGCSNEIWLLSRYLDWAFTEESGIRKMDSRRVFSAVASNDVSRSMAWLFLRNELDRIMTFYGEPSSVSSLISSATAEFNTEIEKYELETFYKENQDTLSAATRTIQEALDRTDGNIAWMEKNYEVIRQWLEDNYPAGI